MGRSAPAASSLMVLVKIFVSPPIPTGMASGTALVLAASSVATQHRPKVKTGDFKHKLFEIDDEAFSNIRGFHRWCAALMRS